MGKVEIGKNGFAFIVQLGFAFVCDFCAMKSMLNSLILTCIDGSPNANRLVKTCMDTCNFLVKSRKLGLGTLMELTGWNSTGGVLSVRTGSDTDGRVKAGLVIAWLDTPVILMGGRRKVVLAFQHFPSPRP